MKYNKLSDTKLTLVIATGKGLPQTPHLLPIGVMSNNDMPWPKLQTDMAWFVEKTTNRPVIMGYKTWLSIPSRVRPLKNRFNIVLSKHHQDQILSECNKTKHLAVAGSIEQALTLAGQQTASFDNHGNPEIAVIGGAALIKPMLEDKLFDKIFLTRIDKSFPQADVNIDNKYLRGTENAIDTQCETVGDEDYSLSFLEILPA